MASHPRASVFHERGWLEALHRTYGYEPVVLTTTEPGKPLANGLVLCRVSSWITGVRLVSLPFSDHCEPLLNDQSELPDFMNWLRAECSRQGHNYFELRLLAGDKGPGQVQSHCPYCLHTLDLTQSLEQIFRSLHRDSIQRRIRRAEREQLSYEVDRSGALVNEFYRLLIMTRRRHGLPPQPRAWFRNLIEWMAPGVQIRLARKNGIPIAALLTLQHGSTVVYKYGCSDENFHQIGAMPFLFWKLIEASKASNATVIDFGRTELDNQGLLTFKDRFGTTRRQVSYFRYSPKQKDASGPSWEARTLGRMFSLLPGWVLPAVARLTYRHIG